MIRRAIVWLCNIVEKPILKLTNKDYQDNSLSELLTLFGSAYNVNIKVFNELQHTITGWPGGKPDADDTYRPERAKPFPKKVIVFSPHPDDDVISMGGTFQRLINQGHQVHVAYETSGNIAVGDEEVIRYLSVMNHMCERWPDNKYGRANNKNVKPLVAEKTKRPKTPPEVVLKVGSSRRSTTADMYMVFPTATFSCLLYETAESVKKNPFRQRFWRVRDFIELNPSMY